MLHQRLPGRTQVHDLTSRAGLVEESLEVIVILGRQRATVLCMVERVGGVLRALLIHDQQVQGPAVLCISEISPQVTDVENVTIKGSVLAYMVCIKLKRQLRYLPGSTRLVGFG